MYDRITLMPVGRPPTIRISWFGVPQSESKNTNVNYSNSGMVEVEHSSESVRFFCEF